MPFVGGNLLLSHSVHVKTVLQATSYEKTSTVSLCFPVAPGQRPSRGAQWLRQPKVTALRLGRAGLVGSWSLRRFSSRGPMVQTAVRGPGDKRWRASGEEAHFSLKGALSPAIISHCPFEFRVSTHIFLFNCFPPLSYITGKTSQMHENQCRNPENTISIWPLTYGSRTNALISCVR